MKLIITILRSYCFPFVKHRKRLQVYVKISCRNFNTSFASRSELFNNKTFSEFVKQNKYYCLSIFDYKNK